MIKNLKLYKKALIVVDMVNGFIYEGPLHDKSCSKIIPTQKEIIENYLNNGDLVIFIKDTHDKNATEFLRMPSHCIKGTKEAELVPELKVYENLDNTISIEKNSTSFNEAPAFRIDEVGVCTDICDFNGIMGLANRLNQENRNVSLNIYENAIKTFSEDARQEYVKAAKLLMKQQGINIIRK